MQVDIRKIGCHIASDFSITLYQTNSLFAFVFFFPQEYLTFGTLNKKGLLTGRD